ncbi:ABC transporter permease [Metamycoplasma hominis]|uniref:Oligopeptide transport system permease protein homolog n=1 Tax=Metamycoplasma hominis TaxID=2098 RepID=Q49553_METHO|nr:ABC transporter permease [Metamycoplasma hominis]MCZ2781317.1 ABC transporter permease [Metamycoplasma hominis]QKX31274.1 ABC transporter permease [Metamycoplasma hominis]QKX39876.1 ABC transporter permease [Metamycoplasma hominis]QKX40431.1 ABC transporter permease [Metamycoplasma hominis]RBI46956.1 ABC transporter permease [Metamycoplasma hominis]
MNINEVKAFNKEYKINTELEKKFKFVAPEDRIVISSVAGKPKKLGIEILKRFFTKPVVLIALAVFIIILLLSILVPANGISYYKPNDPISDNAFVKNLPPASSPIVTQALESNDPVFKFYQFVLNRSETDPVYKARMAFFLNGFQAKVNDVGIYVAKYNAYDLVVANYINGIISKNQITDAEYLKIFNEQKNFYSHVLLGTSSIGYDIWTTAWYATWRAIKIALIVVILEAIIGISIGAFLGFYAGKLIDTIIMRVIEIFLAPPTLIWILLFVSIIGANEWSLVLTLTIVGWPGFVGITRMFIITVKDEEFIIAAKAIGVGTPRRIFVHALPTIIGKIANNIVRSVPGVILWIASLAFLGFFKEKKDTNLGQMLIEASQEVGSNIWIIALPTIILLFLSLSLNFIALGVHDALDPRVMNKGKGK